MTRQSEAGDARRAAREEANLRQRYGPIGIGAVAAAVAVKGRTGTTDEQATSKELDERWPPESMAA